MESESFPSLTHDKVSNGNDLLNKCSASSLHCESAVSANSRVSCTTMKPNLARNALLKLLDNARLIEVITMSTNPNTRAIDNPIDRNGGLVWHRLHSEREDICEALLKECRPSLESQPRAQGTSKEEAMRTANWHRELLQARLRKIDDSLDRLMSGSYGNCSKCGRWIEDAKLEFDPAIAFCISCWQQAQPIH